VIHSLTQVRDQIDATIAFLVEAQKASGACQHEREVNGQTFGQPPHKICLDCGLVRPGSVVK
jgi:hypothetical protein